MRRHAFPSGLRRDPYAAAAYVMAIGTAALYLGSAVLQLLAHDTDREPVVALLSIVMAFLAGLMAWVVGARRITGDDALDRATTALALAIVAAIATTMTLSPDLVTRRLPYLLIIAVACGAVLRRLSHLVVVLVVVSVVWVLHTWWSSPQPAPTNWVATWVVTAGVSLALFGYVRTMLTSSREIQVETVRGAHRDALTGVANRAGFLEQAPALVDDAVRRDATLWCAFLDVDRFKAVNDRAGHAAGDAVLVAVAAALRAESRTTDLVARWGGDEFLVLGVGDEPQEDTLESRVVARILASSKGSPSSWEPGVTVGVASVREVTPGDGEHVVSVADVRMYERRRARRTSTTS